MSQSIPGRRKKKLALFLIALAQFVVIMDTSIVGVALPRMQEELGFSPENLSWVFNAYVITFGGLLLLGGRLADVFGARRMFTTGWVVLLAGSAVAGLAGNVAFELIGRGVQGAGAALIAPAALTLLMKTFGSSPKELGGALALYGAAAPAGGTAGVFLGGVITEYMSWPWVFFINIPLALVVFALVAKALPADGPRIRGSIDIAGALLVTAGLALGVFAIVRAPEIGWANVETWGALSGAAALLALFVLVQARRKQPLMRLSILRIPNLAAANLAQLLLAAAWIPMWFFLNLYLQQVLGYSAFPSGAALLPMTAFIMITMIVLAPRLTARFGPKAMTVTGLIVLAGALLWLSFVRVDGNFWVDILPASLLAALGMSLAFIPTLGTAISSAPPQEGGLASGLVNTSYQVGSALGLATMTAFAAANGATESGNLPALTAGFSSAFIGAAVIALAGALLAAITLRAPTRAPVVEKEATATRP
ncbi:MFS transporter [Cryobacterium melibiosiphilum]|uniref:MFS transporter n=1 Tax=Cryobacterium melibiosiphilum TaxID=995039 RepID=A0A3A5MW87_9MICO|nr:MFS transporter [Cryobacterium melibiosiphilum]RJT91543.1 MFS transporter [Cryobacterium melibiosiphilum]